MTKNQKMWIGVAAVAAVGYYLYTRNKKNTATAAVITENGGTSSADGEKKYGCEKADGSFVVQNEPCGGYKTR